MSCAELMYHQTLSSGFPYHSSQRSLSDVYCGNYNSVIGTSDEYHVQAGSGSSSRMHQPLSRGGSASVVPSSDFSPSSSTSLPVALPSTQPPTPPHHIPGRSSGLSSSVPDPALSLSMSSPCGPQSHLTSSASSSSTSSPPLLTSSSGLSPSLSYFPSSTSSAFSTRTPAHGGSDIAFPPTPASSVFLPAASSLSPASSYSSSLKRSSSEVEDLDDVTVPKKTRYVTSSCVLLTYHEKDTSSEVDDHFSKALSSPSSSCSYGSGGTTRHSSTGDSPPMSQRNFPPSFWDSTHYLRQQCSAAAAAGYNYQAAFGPSSTSSGQAGFFTGAHDPLYPLSSHFLGMPPTLHPSLSSFKDPWASFPFSSGSKSSLNYYPYTRAGAYSDPHAAFSSNYGSSSTGGSSGRFGGSNYSSLLLPSASSVRGAGGHFPPSATITSAQCASGDLGARGVFPGSGNLPGQF